MCWKDWSSKVNFNCRQRRRSPAPNECAGADRLCAQHHCGSLDRCRGSAPDSRWPLSAQAGMIFQHGRSPASSRSTLSHPEQPRERSRAGFWAIQLDRSHLGACPILAGQPGALVYSDPVGREFGPRCGQNRVMRQQWGMRGGLTPGHRIDYTGVCPTDRGKHNLHTANFLRAIRNKKR